MLHGLLIINNCQEEAQLILESLANVNEYLAALALGSFVRMGGLVNWLIAVISLFIA